MRGAWRYVFVFLVVFLVWLPTVTNGLLWDDYVSVQLAPQRWHWWNIRDHFLPAPNTPYLRPLPPLTFYIDESIWGADRYWGWHLTNVTLHALNAVLVAALAAHLGLVASVVAALAFGLHPVNTESVGWISARVDLLMTLFLLASAWLFLRGRRGLSAMAFLGGLLSKEMAVPFPFLVTGWLVLRRRPLRQSMLHWLVLLGYAIYRSGALQGVGGQWEGWHWDIADWVSRPWWAFAYPLPFDLKGWPPPGAFPVWLWWGSAIVCTGIALYLLRHIRLLWPLVVALLVTLLPLLPLFQLGPSFQFGRFLYWPAAAWGFTVGMGFRSALRWWLAPLGLYAVTLIGLGIPPRMQFYEAGATGAAIVRGVVTAVPTVQEGARFWVEGVPTRVHGWGVFGQFLEIPLNEAYGYRYIYGAPLVRVVDVNWQLEMGRQLPKPQPNDLTLRWDGTAITVVQGARPPPSLPD